MRDKFQYRETKISMLTEALFDLKEPEKYRYSLLKSWDNKNAAAKRVAAILFNPSQATESLLDVTVMNLLNCLVPDPKYRAVEVLNMYPVMRSNPKKFNFNTGVPDDKYRLNLEYIEHTINNKHTDHVILGWGGKPGGLWIDNNQELINIITQSKKPLFSFGETKGDKKRLQPIHPSRFHLREELPKLKPFRFS